LADASIQVEIIAVPQSSLAFRLVRLGSPWAFFARLDFQSRA
jgi:hypothetical protein